MGTIPESIGELTQLQTLDLGGTPRARGGLATVREYAVQLVEAFRTLAWLV